MASQAQRLAVAKFRAEKCDRIAADVPKGKREIYKTAANDMGLSLALLIQNGVEEFIKNHAGEKVTLEVKPESISAADRRLLDEFNQLPADVQKKTLALIRAINESKEGGEND